MDDTIAIQTLTARFEGANTVLTLFKVTVVKDTKALEVFKLMYIDRYIANNDEHDGYKGVQYFLAQDEVLAIQTFTHRLQTYANVDKAVSLFNRPIVTDYLDLFK